MTEPDQGLLNARVYGYLRDHPIETFTEGGKVSSKEAIDKICEALDLSRAIFFRTVIDIIENGRVDNAPLFRFLEAEK